MAMTTEEHRSPDGLLTLVVEEIGGGDRAIGFAQSTWHTHPHLLVPRWGATAEIAGRAYVDAVLRSETVIGVRRKDGGIVEAWITDDPEVETDRVRKGEMLEMRHWDGRPWLPRRFPGGGC
jgi:hypothetical protein